MQTPIAHRSFKGQNGTEHFFIIHPESGATFTEQLASLTDAYKKALTQHGLTEQTAIFRRVFFSDILNQVADFNASPLAGTQAENPVATSLLQQPPLPGFKIALLAYHIEAPDLQKQLLGPHHLLLRKNGKRHLWSTQLLAGTNTPEISAADQTKNVFDQLIGTINQNGGTLKANCVRTWLYMKDVDVFYQGLVDSRRKLFLAENLTPQTHYIASTGIEGGSPRVFDVIMMDALTLLDVEPRQISYLNDFERLSPTIHYNVTFERGTTVSFADRRHHYISGTASIDGAGKVLFLGDVIKQAQRAVDNVEALLKSGNATLDDMMYFIVYLRDPSDIEPVSRYLQQRFPTLPMVVVQGPVCRPEWLIEVEGVAVSKGLDHSLPAF